MLGSFLHSLRTRGGKTVLQLLSTSKMFLSLWRLYRGSETFRDEDEPPQKPPCFQLEKFWSLSCTRSAGMWSGHSMGSLQAQCWVKSPDLRWKFPTVKGYLQSFFLLNINMVLRGQILIPGRSQHLQNQRS